MGWVAHLWVVYDADNHLEYEEDGDGDEGLVAVLLFSDKGKCEVGVDGKQDNLMAMTS